MIGTKLWILDSESQKERSIGEEIKKSLSNSRAEKDWQDYYVQFAYHFHNFSMPEIFE